MSDAPTPTDLSAAVGISVSYASMILSGARVPPRSLAINIFRKTAWRHDSISVLSDTDMEALERLDPWSPREEQASAA